MRLLLMVAAIDPTMQCFRCIAEVYAGHTDPELQAIVQGLEVSSPSFRAIFGVLFCDYDVSQGLRG